MNKYILLGLIVGAAAGAALWWILVKRNEDYEFPGFFDSSMADADLFAEGLMEAPDHL